MPDATAEEFAQLREQFIAATDLEAFWNSFLDDWGMRPGFMQMGGPAETEGLEVLVAYIAGKMYGKQVEPEEMRLVKIPEGQFVHGACQLDGELACLLYFEDVERGLLVAPGEGGKTNYARFSWAAKRQQAVREDSGGADRIRTGG